MPNTYDKIFGQAFHKQVGLSFARVKRIAPLVFHFDSTDSRIRDIQSWETMSMPQPWLPGVAHPDVTFGTSFGLRAVAARWASKTTIPLPDIDEDPTRILTQVISSKGGATGKMYASHQELITANFLVSGFSNSTGLNSIDGTGLWSTQHPRSQSNSGSVWSNRAPNDDFLTIDSLDDAITSFTSQKAANGWEYLQTNPGQLIISGSGLGMRRRAKQVLNSPMEFNTANHAPNTLADFNIKLVIWQYFRTTGAATNDVGWILQGEDHGLWVSTLNEVKTDTDINKDTSMFALLGNHDYMVYCEDPQNTGYASLGG